MIPSRAQAVSIDQLETVLPRFLEHLSISRSQIVLDQIRSAVAENPRQLLLVTCKDEEDTPIAAGLVQRPVDTSGNSVSDAATIIHVGPLGPLDMASVAAASKQIQTVIDPWMRRAGIEFVQWATDVSDRDDGVTRWCHTLGFREIAQLQYLSGSITGNTGPQTIRGAVEIRRRPAQIQDADQLTAFARLIERTYVDTLDCPQLAEYRTALQTISGYRQSSAFDPRLWFEIVSLDGDEEPVGCVVLSNHGCSAESQGGVNEHGGVIELVYMGLVPEARGRNWGDQVVAQAIEAARQAGANQMIMAVDQQNQPAKRIYQRWGFEVILTETVWVKRLNTRA